MAWNLIIYASITCLASFAAFVIFKIYYNKKSGMCTSTRKLIGKTVIVTGASSGIGKEAARDFAARGARVLLACRNVPKAQGVAEDIIKSTGNQNIIVYKLDTSDLKSVRDCATAILKKEDRIDVLVNNAGIGGRYHKITTVDGLEEVMATNHYGPFLFTNLLLGLLKESSPSRIVNVSSLAHKFCSKLDPEDLDFDKSKYLSYRAYAQSKLCNVLFTLELSHKLHGTGVTANSLHPGVVDTSIFSTSKNFMSVIMGYFVPLIGKTPVIGAQTIIHLAVSEEVDEVTGKYFVDCKEAATSELANHPGLAKALWTASELDVKMEEDEIHY